VNPNILIPKLLEAGGLVRFISFVADDGRIGSASVYENKEAAERGLRIGREVAGVAEAMKGYQLSQTLQGEIAAVLNADIKYEPAFAIGRLFKTDATAAEVVETIKKARAAAQDDSSRPRTVIVQMDDGRVGSFAAYATKESRDQHTAAISKARENPEHRRLLPNDPETIPSRIITST
jgi:hypothetical protein